LKPLIGEHSSIAEVEDLAALVVGFVVVVRKSLVLPWLLSVSLWPSLKVKDLVKIDGMTKVKVV